MNSDEIAIGILKAVGILGTIVGVGWLVASYPIPMLAIVAVVVAGLIVFAIFRMINRQLMREQEQLREWGRQGTTALRIIEFGLRVALICSVLSISLGLLMARDYSEYSPYLIYVGAILCWLSFWMRKRVAACLDEVISKQVAK